MKNVKKVIATATAAGVLAAALAGCGGQQGKQTETGDGKTFTYWCAMPSVIVSKFQSLGEVSMYKELEKRTGVKIKFVHPPAGQETEQFNLMMASREFTDFIEASWNGYPGGPEKAVNDNVIIKLNDIMGESAPNLEKTMQSSAAYQKQSKTDSGLFYGFPSLNVGKYRTFGGLIIRQDWLDDLGLTAPETISEWETVLRAFKEKKGASSPFTGMDTIFQMGNSIHTFNTAYNVGKGVYVDNGKVRFAPLEPGYKEWIALMSKWYKEGLLDNEYYSNNNQGVDAKMTNDSSGACFGYVGSVIGKYMTAMKDKNPKYRLTAVQYPVLSKGDQPQFTEIQQEANQPFLAITSACKNPAEAAKWADYLFSDEGMMLKNFGVEGETYTMEGGKPTYTNLILHNSEGLSIVEAMCQHFRATMPAPGFNQNEDYLKQYYQLPEQIDAINIWSQYTENSKKTVLPPVTPLAEESEELSSINAEISTYITEQILKFVQGTQPMDQFDGFISQLKKMNVERYVQLHQLALDRYNAR